MMDYELLFGVARKRGAVRLKTAIDEFLLRVDSLPWDSNAVRRYADLRAALEIEGIPMGNLDMMTCFSLRLPLVPLRRLRRIRTSR